MSFLSLLAALLHDKVCFSRQWQNLFDSQELYQNSIERNHLDQAYRNAENSTALSSVTGVQTEEQTGKRLF